MKQPAVLVRNPQEPRRTLVADVVADGEPLAAHYELEPSQILGLDREGKPIPNPDYRANDKFAGRDPEFEELYEMFQAALPLERRRTMQERFEEILQMLVTAGREQFMVDGVVRWPASIVAQLKELGWKEGHPDLWAECELLARSYIETSTNRVAEVDARSVFTAGHGH